MRKGKVIWSNLPFQLNVKINVEKIFLKFVKRHFLKENSLHEIFNKNMRKNSTMRSIGIALNCQNIYGNQEIQLKLL